MAESIRDWLDSLTADAVVVRSAGYGMRSLQAKRVTRVTPTQVVVGSEKFRREDGRLIGGTRSMMTVEIVQPTPEILASIRRTRIISELTNASWSSVPLTDLEKIFAIFSAATQEHES